MFIKSYKLTKKFIYINFVLITTIVSCAFLFISKSFDLTSFLFWNQSSNIQNDNKKDYIKWVDFKVTSDVMEKVANLDISSHNSDSSIKYNWIEILAYLACKNGGNFKQFKQNDLDNLIQDLNSGKLMKDITKDMKYYSYYYESYSAILSGFIGNFSLEVSDENGTTYFENKYGIKAFLPIAKNYAFSHYDDFGASRSYGFKRTHLGNDLMGSIGTPIIAVESGTIEHLGWNQYGGWRVGIRSFDGKRYYYYAHLRKNHPFAASLSEGSVVTAGDVIGYLGMTGYSTKENVNNINVPHLHFGMQLIFDESQLDSNNEIWIDVYQIIEFLKKNRSEVFMNNSNTKDYVRKFNLKESS